MITVKEMVKWSNGQYSVETRLINPDHITSVSPAEKVKRELREDIQEKLDPKATFAEIELVTGTKLVVVGGVNEMQSKLFQHGRKTLLKG